jgi:hypothetical protein
MLWAMLLYIVEQVHRAIAALTAVPVMSCKAIVLLFALLIQPFALILLIVAEMDMMD